MHQLFEKIAFRRFRGHCRRNVSFIPKLVGFVGIADGMSIFPYGFVGFMGIPGMQLEMKELNYLIPLAALVEASHISE